MPDLPLIPRMDWTSYSLLQKNIDESPKNIIPASVGNKNEFLKTYKNQNDRIGKIYRFEKPRISHWKIIKNKGIGGKSVFHHASLFLSLYFVGYKT